MSSELVKRTVTRSVSLGSLQNRISDNSVSVNSNSVTASKRKYTLDREKALEKKLQKCDSEHVIFEMKAGKNFVVWLSTSAYELAKSEIKNILQSPDLIGQFGIQTQIGLDSSDVNTDTCFKVYNRRQNGAVGNIAKFTVNFYHTTNTITVNGSRVDVFINNIFDKLCEFIRSKHPELDIANATIANQINSLRSLSTSNTVNIAMNCIEPDKECSSQADILTHDSQYSEQMNVEEESVNEEVAFCPFCEHEVTVEGIYCVECESWLHYGCVNLDPETVSNTFRDTEYVCINQCNEETLYGDNQNNTQETSAGHVTSDTNSVRESTPSIQSTGPNNMWNMPNAMSVTGTCPKSPTLRSDPNIDPSISHDGSASQALNADNSHGPNKISPESDSPARSNRHASSPTAVRVTNPPLTPKPRRPLPKKHYKSDKGKTETSCSGDAAISLAQKMRILDLENEIKQLRNALESVKTHTSNAHPSTVEPQPVTSTAYMNAHPDNLFFQQTRHDQLEGRLRMLEHQVVQNMCISTAVTAQLAIQVNMNQQKVREVYPQLPAGASGPMYPLYQSYLPMPYPQSYTLYPNLLGSHPFVRAPSVQPPSYIQAVQQPMYNSQYAQPQRAVFQNVPNFNGGLHIPHNQYAQPQRAVSQNVPNFNGGSHMTYNPLNSAGQLASGNVLAGIPNLPDASHSPSTTNNNTQYPQPTQKDDTNMTDTEVLHSGQSGYSIKKQPPVEVNSYKYPISNSSIPPPGPSHLTIRPNPQSSTDVIEISPSPCKSPLGTCPKKSGHNIPTRHGFVVQTKMAKVPQKCWHINGVTRWPLKLTTRLAVYDSHNQSTVLREITPFFGFRAS